MAKTACVLLIDGFEEVEAVTVIDVLRRADVDVTVVGVEARSVTGSHAIALQADALLADVVGRSFDAVVLPGGMPGSAKLRDHDRVRSFVVDQHKRGALTTAICAAPIALAKFGLLEGKHATCYPGFEDQLTGAKLAHHDAVVVDGAIITSRGVGTALNFALVLVDKLAGTDMARTLATRMLVER